MKSIPTKLVYLLFFGLLLRLVLAWLPDKYFFYLISDDSYYYYTIAQNWIERGFFSADGLTQTNGFHPLWLFVITPIFAGFQSSPWFPIHLVISLAAFFDTAAAFLLYRTLAHLGREKVGMWAAAFYLVNPFGLLHTMNGLETALNNFLLSFLVYLSSRATADWLKTGCFYLGTISGLALLARTDNIFAVGVLLGYLVWRDRRWAPAVKTAAVAASLVVPWQLYNLATFGSIVQTSGTSYPYHLHQQFLRQYGTFFTLDLFPFLARLGFQTFAENAYHYGDWVFMLILTGILLQRLRRWPPKYRPVLWTLLGAALFWAFHTFLRWSVRPWYPQAVFVLTLPVIALALEKLNRYFLGIGFALILFVAGWTLSQFRFRIADRSPVMLKIINEQIPAGDLVGVFNSGYLQYFTDLKVINLDGLVNNEVLHYYKKRAGLEYFLKRRIRWLVDTQTYLGGIFGPYFGPEAESLLATVSVVPNIVYPGNNVFLIEVTPDGIHPPAGDRKPFGRMLKVWQERGSRWRWGPIPFLHWLKKLLN